MSVGSTELTKSGAAGSAGERSGKPSVGSTELGRERSRRLRRRAERETERRLDGARQGAEWPAPPASGAGN